MRRWAWAFVAAAAIASACGGPGATPPASTTAPDEADTGAAGTVAPDAETASGLDVRPAEPAPTGIPEALRTLAAVRVDLGGDRLLLVAAESGEWTTGLRGVADLGDADGLLFDFGRLVGFTFSMDDVLIPLDIAFFDETGVLVGAVTMPVCEAAPCPTFGATAPYRYAVEAAAGEWLDALPNGTSLPTK